MFLIGFLVGIIATFLVFKGKAILNLLKSKPVDRNSHTGGGGGGTKPHKL